MKKQITLLLCLLTIFGIAKAQTPDPGTWESLENQIMQSKYSNSKVGNSTANLLGLSQVYSSTGKYTVSADGKGSTGSSMTIRVNKPNAAATVQKAILMSSATGATIANGCVTLSGVGVNWNGSAASGGGFNFNNYWADVTSIVAAQINSFPAGTSNLNITECNSARIEGEALLVVFNDAAATEKTIIIMFGAAAPTGDNFSVSLAEPIDPEQPGALLDMGLGIGFSFQGTTGGSQISQVSVNSQRLSSSAGGEDDGTAANGALITVGGIGDVNTNPANPLGGSTNLRTDDELYNILPFITNTTTSLNITTFNPSNNDNIFLAYFALSGAAIIGEGILLSQTASSGNVGTNHTVKASVKNTLGQPIPNKLVTFTITAGPNSALSPFSTTTDVNGEANFTYTGSGGIGIDNIVACFTNSQNVLTCSNTLSFQWVAPPEPPTISCPENVTVNNATGQCGANVSYTAATTTGTPTPTITYSHASGSFFTVGTTTVTATATNINGTATCTFTVTVNDNENPTITCPAPITIQCNTPVPDPDINSVTVTDNCSAGITVTWEGDQFTPGNCPGNFIITRTYQAKDASNNVATCTQTITVVDNTPPTLTVPANVTLQCSDPLPLMPLNINSSPNFIEGTYNIGTATFGAPLTSTPLTADAVMVDDGSGGAGNPYDACETILNDLTGKIAVIERGGCTGPANFFVNKAFKAQQAGAVGVIFIFNQPGNHVATMGLPPGPNPTITIPLMLVSNDYGNMLKAEILAGATNVSLSAPTVIASDLCSFTSLTHQQTFTPGNCQSSYTLVNTWTATDQCGNANTASQTITVVDNTPPTLTVPANVTLQCSDPLPMKPLNINASSNGMEGTYIMGTAVFGPQLTNTPVTGNVELVDDNTGNTADACEPILNDLTGNIAVIDRGGCPVPNGLFTSKVLKAQNAGAIAVIIVNNLPGDNILTMGGANPLITIPSVFVSNNYGNALKASMALGTVNVSLSASPVTATDNCSNPLITSYTEVVTTGNCPGNYSILKTWTATDACGNANSASQTITVIDDTDPVITCPGNITVNNAAGQCGANVSFAATGTDNCGTPVITYSHNPGSFFAVGTTIVTATATDACNNTSQCTFSVIVIDNEKPVINVNNIARCYADDNFGCSINLGATATDNCAVQSLTSNAPTCFPVGTTTVTWTATDIHGNVTTKTQLVTRNPEININICAGPTRTIYTGTTSGVGPFGPQSVNLSSIVSGGTPGYSYKWTPSAGLNNALIANPVASPAVTTIYTLTVTDSKGCKRSLSITINVLPLSAAVCSGNSNNIKFSVCHIPPGNPSNPQNICISVNALNAHLTSGSHGHNNCYLGPCQQNCFSTIPGAASLITQTVHEEVIVEEAPIVEVQQPDFKVNVYPNPSAYDFSIQVISKSNELITVRILDLNGKVSSVQTQLSKTGSIKVGSKLIGGTYFAEVTQGSNRQVVKLVKLN